MSDDLAILVMVLFAAAFFVFAVYVNIRNARRRAKMTPEERKRDYEDLRIPGDW